MDAYIAKLACFPSAYQCFYPISNENLPRLKQLNIERSEFFKALNKANSSCWLDINTYTARENKGVLGSVFLLRKARIKLCCMQVGLWMKHFKLLGSFFFETALFWQFRFWKRFVTFWNLRTDVNNKLTILFTEGVAIILLGIFSKVHCFNQYKKCSEDPKSLIFL